MKKEFIILIALIVFWVSANAQNKTKTFESATIERIIIGKSEYKQTAKIKVSYDASKKQYSIIVLPDKSLFDYFYQDINVIANANSEQVDAIKDCYVYECDSAGRGTKVLTPEKLSYLFNSEIGQKYRTYSIRIKMDDGPFYWNIVLYFSTKK